MGSYDTFGDRFGVDQDTIDALNARYGEPVDAVIPGATNVAGGNPNFDPVNPGNNSTPSKVWLDEHAADATRRGGVVAQPQLAPGQMAAVPKDASKPQSVVEGERAGAAAGAQAAAGINPTEDFEDVGEGASALRQGGGASGGGPAHVGWIPKQRQANFGYSQEEVEPWRQATSDRQEASQMKGEAENELAGQKGTRDATYAAHYAAAAERHEEQMQALQNRRDQYMTRELERLNELSVQSQKEVDPDAYWKEQGGLAEFIGILAVAGGAFGSSLTGGVNQAQQMINAKIDRNIRAQEHNIAQKGKALSAAENIYQRNLDAFGDRERAVKATRVNYLDRVGAELDAKLADESLPIQERQRYQALKEKMLADKASTIGDFTKLTHTQISQADAFGSMGGGGGGAGAGKALENTVQLADGTVVQLDGTAQANEVAKTLGYHSQMQQLDQRALKLRNELAGLDPVGDRVKYQSVYRELEMAGKDRSELSSQAKGQGVITKEDAKREEAVGLNYTQGYGGNVATGTFRSHIDPTAKGDREIGNNTIRSSIERSGQQERALVTAHRGRIIRGEYQRDAAGNLKPVDRYTGQDPHPTEHRAPNGFTPISPDARVPTRGTSLSEDTPHAPVTAAPAGGAGSGVTFNIVGGGGGKRGGGGGGKRKRK